MIENYYMKKARKRLLFTWMRHKIDMTLKQNVHKQRGEM